MLKRPGNWTPPDEAVEPGEEWAAARRAIRQQAGMTIQVEQPKLVERMQFYQFGEPGKAVQRLYYSFSGYPGKGIQ